MKIHLIALAIVAFTYTSGVAFAQQSPDSAPPNEEATTYLVATVNLQDISYVQEGSAFAITFNISNRIGIQPGVRYGVLLTQVHEGELSIEDSFVAPEPITLDEGTIVKKSLMYHAPGSLSGTYTLYLVSENDSGLRYAFAPIGMVSLTSETSGVVIDAQSCVVSVKGSETSYARSQVVPSVGREDMIVYRCMVENTSTESVKVAPTIITRERTAFGRPAPTQPYPIEEVLLAAKEKREVAIEIPVAEQPMRYDVSLSYGANGNETHFQYVTHGVSAAIENLVFDKSSYQSGEIATLSFAWSAVLESQEPRQRVEILVTDAGSGLCTETLTQTLDAPVVEIRLPVVRNCAEPVAEIAIVDDALGVLARATYAVTLPRAAVAVPTSVAPATERPILPMNVALVVSIVGLLLGLGLLGYSIWRRRQETKYTTPIVMLLFAVAGTFVADTSVARADTFFLGWYGTQYTVVVALNKSSYYIGESTLRIQGTTERTVFGSEFPECKYYAGIGGFSEIGGFSCSSSAVQPFNFTHALPGTAGSYELRFLASGNTHGVYLPFTVAEPIGCVAELKTWTKNGATCSGMTIDVPAGQVQSYTVVDDVGTEQGQITYGCFYDGVWYENPLHPKVCNRPPSVEAGENRLITLPVTSTTPSGASTSDPDGNLSSTSWGFISGPGPTPTIDNTNQVFEGLTQSGTYTFRLTATDTLGATAYDEMQVIVSDPPPPSGEITASPMVVDLNGTTMLSWNASDYSSTCWVTGTNGQHWNFIPGTNVETAPLTTDTSFALMCDNNKLVDGVFITVNPDVSLSVYPQVIDRGGSVTLTWDTKGNSPELCSFSGGGLSGAPSAEADSIVIGGINAQTTFRLICGNQSEEKSVYMRPQSWEP